MPGECWCFRTQRCWARCSRTTAETRRWKRTGERTTPGWQRSRLPAAARRSGTNTTIRTSAASAYPMPTQTPRSTALHGALNAFLWRWAIPESVAALALLSAAGLPLGVVSNTSGQIAEVLSRSGVCQAGNGPHTSIRVVVDSHLVGVSKPDPRIFDHALPFFGGIERNEIAYVGDSVTMDIGATSAAGLHPILLDPYDDHPEAEFQRIRTLTELTIWLLD